MLAVGLASAGCSGTADPAATEALEQVDSEISIAPEPTWSSRSGFSARDYCENLPGYNPLIGTVGNDSLEGGVGPDCIAGFGGADTIDGAGGDDIVFAGDGADLVYGSIGHDVIYGGSGNDTIYGNDGNDIIDGEGGSDKLYGGNGDDALSAGTGNDSLYGQAGVDRLFGGGGSDYLNGGADADSLHDCDTGTVLDGSTGADNCFADLATSTLTSCTVAADCATTPSGTNGDVLATTSFRAYGITLSDTDVYVGSYSEIWRVSKAGGALSTFLQSSTLGLMIQGGIDIGGPFVYWTSYDTSPPVEPHALLRTSLASGISTVRASDTDGLGPFSAPQVANGQVYTESGVWDGSAVHRTSETGSSGRYAVVTDTNFPGSSWARRYYVQGTNLYYVEKQATGHAIFKTSAFGGTRTSVTPTLAFGNAYAITADDTHVYLAADGTLLRVPVAGGVVQTLSVEADYNVNHIAIDATHVYWLSTNYGVMGSCEGLRLRRVAKTGGLVTTLEEYANECGQAIAIDDDAVYWIQSAAAGGGSDIHRRSK